LSSLLFAIKAARVVASDPVLYVVPGVLEWSVRHQTDNRIIAHTLKRE